MTTVAHWVQGARPRTLPNAIAPVVVGVGAAVPLGAVSWPKAALALVVAIAMIIGVNFANDYSDGIRGTDDARVGPMRLVGSGAASATAVKRAAFCCFAVGAIAGTVLAATTAWWLLAVGAISIAGAWFYTGGAKPYGYIGLGEVAVFVFFGLVAVLGTQFATVGQVDWRGMLCAIAIGSFSSAVLVANNLRDIPTDTESGKTTLAVRLGDQRTRTLFEVLLAVPLVVTLPLAIDQPLVAVAYLSLPLIFAASRPVRTGATGPGLIPSLAITGLAMLAWAVLTGVSIALLV